VKNRTFKIRAVFIVIIFMIFLLQIFACDKGKDKPGALDNSGNVRIINPGFEIGGGTQTPGGWNTNTDGSDQDADYTQMDGKADSFCLVHSKNTAYKVFTFQQIEGLDAGYYSLSVWVKNGGGQNACYLTASDYGDSERMTSLPVSSAWTQVIIRGINITNGKCKIGFYSDALPGNWCKMDDVKMIKDDNSYQFIKGGDLSELSYIESMGGKYFENGVQKDGMQILKDNGFNMVRLRLYNDPGNPDFTPSKRLPTGFQDQDDILRLSKRAKDLGLQIQLTFYYSDYWSNDKPHAWQNISFPALKDSVFKFTLNFMNLMKAQGTTPEYVSLGNEIAGGLLKPDGASGNFTQMAEILKQGYKAVKEISPETKVILHLDDAGNKDKYDWFFGGCKTNGVEYDIIGASYYPFWTKKTVAQVIDWAEYVSTKFAKDIIIMETGYNWNPTLPDGKNGQLSNNGPYDAVYPSSPSGQRDFLLECFNGLKCVEKGRIIGALYWDPVMIEVPGVGWELGADNVVSNTTLFDFEGNALPALKVFKFNN
jgi:arabinogalactan endo-1,4-beta-galactosidase